MRKFEITFQENSKYNPVKRTVTVDTNFGKEHAIELVHFEFGSFKKNKEPSNKITILKTKEIKEKKSKKEKKV